MTLPFYNFHDLHNAEFKESIKARISNIIDEGSFIEGPYNFSFEEKFAKMQESKHCLLVGNGTDALEISLQSCNVGPGDFVGVPGITFYATAEAVLNVGATPIFIDILPDTGLMCPDSLQRVSNKYNLKAIIPVHIYGLPADMDTISQICQSKKIPVIEDAAQAQGAFLSNKPIGSSGNLTTFSFYPTKNLSAFGDAGCILTNDDAMADKIKNIRNHGRGNVPGLGRNSRCDHINAAVLDLKLEKVEQQNEQRKKIAKSYHEILKSTPIEIVDHSYLTTSSWHLYPIKLKSIQERKSLQEHLQEKGISCAPFYEKALSQEEDLSQYLGETKQATEFAGKVLCIPMNPFLSMEEVQLVGNEINSYFSNS